MHNNIGIYSCYFPNISDSVAEHQQMVFNKFGLTIEQTKLVPNDFAYGHGMFINDTLNTTNKEYVIFFDIDCIPLSAEFYEEICNDMFSQKLSGAIGCANHIDQHKTYIHPCFMGFSLEIYNKCHRPNLVNDGECDTAQRLTNVCIEKNIPLKYWEITDSADNYWPMIPRNTHFGHGTIFKNIIYHQYEGRFPENQTGFINKCKQILDK